MLKVYWFRKDLRLYDNKGLSEFIKSLKPEDKYLFLYVKNKNTFKYFGEMRVAFLYQCLNELSSSLKERNLFLNVINGKSIDVFRTLTEKYGKVLVYANKQVEPYCLERDIKVTEFLYSKDSEINFYSDSTLFETGEVVKDDGTPYTVFTPFSKKCYSLMNESHYHAYSVNLEKLITGNNVEISFDSYEVKKSSPLLKGGRKEGLKLLKEFYENGLSIYKSRRDFPWIKGTSLVSPHLHFGTISIRECWRAGLKKNDEINDSTEVKTWMNELLWREFYYNITHHFPYIIEGAFKPLYNKLEWNYDNELFQKWCDGKTGYPIVDAGMRQLNVEGWMHNRVRMITAMFLTKDLFIDWKWGEKYFAEKLIDFDFASNNGGWQWSASTGCDAQPYFRIFNPYLQSAKFDENGDYIRKYVPELKNVPVKFIHKPDEMTEEQYKEYGAMDYPKPLIDHHSAKEWTLSQFKKLSENK